MTTKTISAKQVKELRDRTGAGMMDCKRALREADGDMEQATHLLRVRGVAKAAQRAARETSEGAVGSYIHMNGRIGVLIEVGCETDFVAKTDDFQRLVFELAMHIAAAAPLAVREGEIPPEVAERERKVYLEQVRESGKPEKVWDKIVSGKMQKFHAERVLLKQPFVKEPDISVEDFVTRVAARTGEKIEVRRFTRYALGE
ncbi:MAG: translation elongation factor Ts [Longimicrobiaceae bacterium]